MRKYLTLKYIVGYSFLNYLQAGFSFLVSFILANQLEVEDFGYYFYGLVIAGILNIVSQFGTDKSLVRDLVQLEDSKNVMIASTILKSFLGLVLLLGILFWMYWNEEEMKGGLGVSLAFLIYGIGLSLSPKSWYDYKGKINLHATIFLGEKIVFAGVAIFAVYFHIENAFTIIVLSLFLTRGCALFSEWYIIRSYFLNVELKPSAFYKRIIKDNYWIWLATIGNLMMTHGNQIILKDKINITELAYYGIAFQFIALVRLLQSQILRLSAPAIARQTSQQEIKTTKGNFKEIGKHCLLSFGMTLLIIIPLYLFSPTLLKLLRDDYINAKPILDILLLWSLIFGVALIINQYLLGYRLQAIYFKISIVFGIFSLILSQYLIPIYGGVGAALALLIGHSLAIMFQTMYVFKKILSISHD